MKKQQRVFKLGELFCGPGGLALGACRARLEHKGTTYSIEHGWANDIDLASCKTYARNILGDKEKIVSLDSFNESGKGTVIAGDVRWLKIDNLPKIDGFAFGFPCNDYSLVGEKKGLNGRFGPLYTYGADVLDNHEPQWFLAENVSGLQSASEGQAFAEILKRLEHAGTGYELTVHLYPFEKYGVPQTRSRIIIVGIKKALGLKFKVPAPTTPIAKPVGEALSDIPIWAKNQEKTKQSPQVVERLREIPPGENAWYKKLPPHLQLNVKGARMSQIYRKLDPEKPSYTITGSGGGGTHGYHWEEPRALTNRERARIQTFPDDFVFEGSKEQVRKQIGMAVPPTGAQVIFEAILKTLAGVDYDSIPAKVSDSHKARQKRANNAK